MLRARLESTFAGALLWILPILLLLCASRTSSSATTPSPTTPSPSGTSSPGTPSPTIAPSSSSGSSSGSDSSRGTVVAWAIFTMAVCVGLMVLLYNREQRKRRRIHQGHSLRQDLRSPDVFTSPFSHEPFQKSGQRDPTMSSF